MKSLKEVTGRALHLPGGRTFQKEGIASPKALRGHMAGNEISASGVEGWEEKGVRSEVSRASEASQAHMCHSNFEDKRRCIEFAKKFV